MCSLLVSTEKSFYLQETIPSNQQSYTARELRSGTDYLITVIAQYPNSLGESVSGKARTSENWTQQKYVSSKLASLKKLSLSPTPNHPLEPLQGVTALRLIQAGVFTLALGWDTPADQVQGYRITYGPTGETETLPYG